MTEKENSANFLKVIKAELIGCSVIRCSRRSSHMLKGKKEIIQLVIHLEKERK